MRNSSNSARARAPHFLRNRSGGAAIELALIAPVLAVALVGIADLSMRIFDRLNMQSAVRAGLQYTMSGGGDLVAARAIVLDAWTDRPADASVVAELYCLCGETVTVCTNSCSGGAPPKAYTRINASGTLGRFFFSEPVSSSEAARVR